MPAIPAKPDENLARHALDECRTGLLETLAGLLRDFKFINIKVIEATQAAAREQFDTLAGMRDRKSFEATRSLTASRISLVHEEDLEFSIRLSDLAQQIRERCELPLGRLHLRFMTILDQQEAAPEQLPVGPETVCCALRAMSNEAGLDPDARLQLLQEMRNELTRRLRELYEKLDARMDALGIEQKSFMRPASERASAGRGGMGGAAPSSRDPRVDQRAALDPTLADALRDRMVAWLEEQLSQGSAAQVSKQLSRTELAGLLPADARETIDRVELALQRLGDHTDVPAPAKQALEGLRMPVLKLALREPAFLGDADHPALRLLNALAREASELPHDVAPGSTQLNLIEASVSRLVREYNEDSTVFQDVFDMLEQARSERLNALSRRVEPLARNVAHEERNEIARRHASQAIRALCAQDPPRTVQMFLEYYWSVVLRRTLLNYGEGSDEWTQALKTADHLVWSTQPKTDAGERERLVSILPKLVQRIQNGLEAIRVSPETRTRLLERFTQLHTEALHGRDPKITEPPITAPPEESSRLDPLGGSEDVRILRRPGYVPRDTEMPSSWSELTPGHTLRFVLPDGSPASGTIAQIGAQRQIWVLQMRPDAKLLAITWAEIMHQQLAGTVSHSSPPVLFD